jgi:phosphoglucomutase
VDSTIVDSFGRGIYLGANASGAVLVGNLVVRGDRGILLGNGVSGVILRHNTLVYQEGDGLVVGAGNARR